MNTKRTAALGALCASLVIAAPAGAATVRGTVVQRSATNHTFNLVRTSGALVSVRANSVPRIGRVVKIVASKLADGTLRASSVKVTGRTHRVRVRGTVSFASRSRSRFVIAGQGASMAAKTRSVPAVGSDVTASGPLEDDGDLKARHIHDHGDDHDGFRVEGTISAVDTTARTLTVTPEDDEDAPGAAVTISVPDSIDISTFAVGQKVELKVRQLADGTLELVALSECHNRGQRIEGTITAIDTAARTITVDQEHGDPVTISVPASFDLSTFTVGQTVELKVTTQADGSLLLVDVDDQEGHSGPGGGGDGGGGHHDGPGDGGGDPADSSGPGDDGSGHGGSGHGGSDD